MFSSLKKKTYIWVIFSVDGYIYIYRCNLLSLLMLLDMGGRLGQTTRKQKNFIAVGGV